MTATNHALTGAAIGLYVGQPISALIFAFLSHFVLDALPHYGPRDSNKAIISRAFKIYLIGEALLCFVIVLLLIIYRPAHWNIAAFAAFLAASPDFYWIKKYRAALTHQKYTESIYSKFASKIQWFQKPIGAVVELAWAGALIVILLPVL